LTKLKNRTHTLATPQLGTFPAGLLYFGHDALDVSEGFVARFPGDGEIKDIEWVRGRLRQLSNQATTHA